MELDDIQGLLRFGYGHLTEACFLLLRVKDPRRCARLVGAGADDERRSTADPPPETALHVAFTSEGLRALGVRRDIVEGFSAEFVTGMASDAAPRAPARRCRRQRSKILALGRRRAACRTCCHALCQARATGGLRTGDRSAMRRRLRCRSIACRRPMNRQGAVRI